MRPWLEVARVTMVLPPSTATETLTKTRRKRRKFRSAGLKRLIEEGDVMEKDGAPEVLDALLISAAQRVEHYEISGYGIVRTLPSALGEDDAVQILPTDARRGVRDRCPGLRKLM